MFSSRVPDDLEPNRLARGRRRARRRGTRADRSHRDESDRGRHRVSARRCSMRWPIRAARRTNRGRSGLPGAREAVAARLRAARSSTLPGSHRADGQHQRGVFRSVQAPVRALGRRRDGAGPQLSAVRSSDAARRRRPVPYRLEYHGRWAVDLRYVDSRMDRPRPRGAGGQPEQPHRVGPDRRRAGRARGGARSATPP